jgi:hypothetical protein
VCASQIDGRGGVLVDVPVLPGSLVVSIVDVATGEGAECMEHRFVLLFDAFDFRSAAHVETASLV